MRCRPASACASVPPSTYSSSPPIGTPCAIRVARMPRARELAEEVRGRLAFHRRVGREDQLLAQPASSSSASSCPPRAAPDRCRRAATGAPSARSSGRGSCRTARPRPRPPATRPRTPARVALLARFVQITHSSPSVSMRQRRHGRRASECSSAAAELARRRGPSSSRWKAMRCADFGPTPGRNAQRLDQPRERGRVLHGVTAARWRVRTAASCRAAAAARPSGPTSSAAWPRPAAHRVVDRGRDQVLEHLASSPATDGSI
jgi:hypothetical protein